MPLEAGLLEILACPACHAPLREGKGESEASGDGGAVGEGGDAGDAGDGVRSELVCTGGAACGLVYPIRDGIPVLLVDEARRPA